MKLIPLKKINKIKVTKSCTAYEYPNGDKDIWGAVIKINGRYPNRGRTVNLKCKELVYFLRGKGKLVVERKSVSVQKGDQVVIEKGERFYWQGKLTMFMPCSPAWYPEQHKEGRWGHLKQN